MRAYHQGSSYTVEFTDADTTCFTRHTGADPSVVKGRGSFTFDTATGDLIGAKGAAGRHGGQMDWLAFSQDAQDQGRSQLAGQHMVVNPCDLSYDLIELSENPCGGPSDNPARISRTRGVKTMRGPYDARRGYRPWITRRGKLGEGFLTKMSKKQRQDSLDRCVSEYGYRSCLGSILVLERAKTGPYGKGVGVGVEYASKLKSSRDYLRETYGGPGSFGPRPEVTVSRVADANPSGRRSNTEKPIEYTPNPLCCLEWDPSKPSQFLWRSRGGGIHTQDARRTKAGTGSRNYKLDLAVLLRRLSRLGVGAHRVAVDTRTTTSIPLAKRTIASNIVFPSDVASSNAMRARLGTAAARVGRPKGAKGGGNTTKTLRFYLSRDLTAAELKKLDKKPTTAELKGARTVASNPEGKNEEHRMHLKMSRDLNERTSHWHGGMSSYVYSLVSVGMDHCVSQSMIRAAIGELESDLVWVKEKQKEDQQELEAVIGELDLMARLPGEYSDDNCINRDGTWKYSEWLIEREGNPSGKQHRLLAGKFVGDATRALREARDQMDQCMRVIANGKGLTAGGRLTQATKMRCNQACHFAGFAYRRALAAQDEATHGGAEGLHRAAADLITQAASELNAMGCPHTEGARIPGKAAALQQNPSARKHQAAAKQWARSGMELELRAAAATDAAAQCGYLWMAYRSFTIAAHELQAAFDGDFIGAAVFDHLHAKILRRRERVAAGLNYFRCTVPASGDMGIIRPPPVTPEFWRRVDLKDRATEAHVKKASMKKAGKKKASRKKPAKKPTKKPRKRK